MLIDKTDRLKINVFVYQLHFLIRKGIVFQLIICPLDDNDDNIYKLFLKTFNEFLDNIDNASD